MNAVCVLQGGPVYSIDVGGQRIMFEMHPYLGPVPVGKRGNERRLGPRHPFWQAVTWWQEQGRGMDLEDPMLARWSRPAPLKLRHLGGRNYEIVR